MAFSVIDNGKGISPDKMSVIFSEKESDQRGDNWDGCGLGLPVCQQLAGAIYARIYYNSVMNEGTTFMLVMKKNDICNVNEAGVKKSKLVNNIKAISQLMIQKDFKEKV